MNNDKPNILVKLAKRDNNTKRPYLLVNPLQGKHVPVNPCTVFEMVSPLADRMRQTYKKEQLLLIGFAETATAIGAAIAASSPQVFYYIHTTREAQCHTENYLYFSEVHSHATNQKLSSSNLDQMLSLADRIIFIEDEITTGNTILNLIQKLKEHKPSLCLKFGIVSILNSMEDSVLDFFQKSGISCTWLQKISPRNFSSELESFSYPSECRIGPMLSIPISLASVRQFHIPGKLDPRIGVTPEKYMDACKQLAKHCIQTIDDKKWNGKKILVLGTEEFMFPPLYLAEQLQKQCPNSLVYFHASTRSPILPSPEEAYPLKRRNELLSIYEDTRTTYLYNLDCYDLVLWLHDSITESQKGMESMINALSHAQCKEIYIYQWEDSCEKQL